MRHTEETEQRTKVLIQEGINPLEIKYLYKKSQIEIIEFSNDKVFTESEIDNNIAIFIKDESLIKGFEKLSEKYGIDLNILLYK